MKKFIVSEVTKNWDYATERDGDFISQRFELVLNENAKRGYRLVDWKLNTVINESEGVLTETIVAIFEQMYELGNL